MSTMKAAFILPSAARFINKEGRDDFRKTPSLRVRKVRLSKTTFPLRKLGGKNNKINA